MGKGILVGAAVLMAVLLLIVAGCLVYPDVSALEKKRPAKSAFMEYRERQWQKAGLHKRIRQEWVPLSRISPYAVKAVIISEDDKFWSHEGFDFEAIQKALEKDIRKGQLRSGGSTISQQLVKNLYLSPSKNPVRKLREAILTWRLERNLSKRRIVELYLNVAEWGDGIFGIEAASRHYFAKAAADLTAREAARLAVVLPNPLRYHPTGGGPYVERRAEAIHRIMVRRGIVVPDYEEVMQSKAGDTVKGAGEEGRESGETASAPAGGEAGESSP
jgi:monofunctional biosynthetic peptidoglycan transglycosylase